MSIFQDMPRPLKDGLKIPGFSRIIKDRTNPVNFCVCGTVPHSGLDTTSKISYLKNTEEFPPVVQMVCRLVVKQKPVEAVSALSIQKSHFHFILFFNACKESLSSVMDGGFNNYF